MASRGKGARIKGSSFEREIANFLTEHTGIQFKRGLGQARSGGAEVADVTTDVKLRKPVHFELKRQIKCNIKGALEQALRDAPTKIPIIITKDDRQDALVTMRLNDWIEMFKEWLEK